MKDRIHSLVIGGTRGIGREQVRAFAARDHVVSVIGRTLPPDSCSSGVHYWSADLTDRTRLTAVLDEIVERNGKVNNLVFFQRYRGNGDNWTGEIETSLTATRNTIEHLLSSFAASGSIVAVGSMASHFVAAEQPLSYHVAKAGLDQIVRYYAFTCGPNGLRVNGVTPGAVLKEGSKHVNLEDTALSEVYQKIIPLRRMATPGEIVNVICFLCSAEASFITGQIVVVDGGLSLSWQESLPRSLSKVDGTQTARDAKQSLGEIK